MSDSVSVTPGTGAQIATDRVGQIDYQAVKIATGVDGEAELVSSHNPMPAAVSFADSGAIDAFGNLRTTTPFSLFDLKVLHDKQPLFMDEETSDGGSETSVFADSRVAMTVTADGEYVVRQTKARFNYEPGKSQKLFLTGVLDPDADDVEVKIGYFNTSTAAPYTADIDGLWFGRSNDGTISVNRGRNGDTYSITAADSTENERGEIWFDALDGTGPSQVDIDWTIPQIFMIDFEWLSLGRVRWYVVIDGALVHFASFNNADKLSIAEQPYMLQCNHSVRYEIRSTGGTGTMYQGCFTVQSEGGQDQNGIVRGYHMGIGGGEEVDSGGSNVQTALIGIRLKTDRLDTWVSPLDFTILCDSGADMVWQVTFNPTKTGGTFNYVAQTDSAVEIARGATGNNNSPAITGGTIIGAGYISANRDSDRSEVENALRLGATIAGVRDEIVISVATAGAEDVFASLSWRELV